MGHHQEVVQGYVVAQVGEVIVGDMRFKKKALPAGMRSLVFVLSFSITFLS